MGTALEEHPEFFETEGVFRPGNMVDYLLTQAESDTKVSQVLLLLLLLSDSGSKAWWR